MEEDAGKLVHTDAGTLVDLDRATFEKPLPVAAKDAMLVRMARYLARHKQRIGGLGSRVDRLRFLRGLGLDRRWQLAVNLQAHADVLHGGQGSVQVMGLKDKAKAAAKLGWKPETLTPDLARLMVDADRALVAG